MSCKAMKVWVNPTPTSVKLTSDGMLQLLSYTFWFFHVVGHSTLLLVGIQNLVYIYLTVVIWFTEHPLKDYYFKMSYTSVHINVLITS